MSWFMREMRQRLMVHPDFSRVLGFYSTASARSATAITDNVKFGTQNLGEFHYSGCWVRHPHLTDATGRVKQMDALSGNTLLHDDAENWAAPFTTLYYELTYPGIHPDAFDACICEGLKYVYLQNDLPETPWEDGNFEALDLDSWTGVNAALSKVADQVYGLVGSWSLKAINSAANGYAAHTSGITDVQPRQQYQLNALGLNVSGAGPLYWRIYDFTGGVWGAEITPAAVAYGHTPTHFRRDVTIPANCYAINCRMEHASNGGIHAWDALPGRLYGQTRFELASYQAAGFNVIGLSEAVYGETLPGQSVNAEVAKTKDYASWEEPVDYDSEHLAGNSSPNALRLNRPPASSELWVASTRTWWDVQPIDELTPSDAPFELALAATAANLCDLLNPDGSDPSWLGVRARHKSMLDAQIQARKASKPPKRREFIGGRVGPR